MRLMITGSRSFANRDFYAELVPVFRRRWFAFLERAVTDQHVTELVQGCADGPDTWAEHWLLTLDYYHDVDIRRFPIRPMENETYGQAAYRRNLEMLDTQPDLLVACWDGQSRGTLHTIEAAMERSITPVIFDPRHP